MGLTLGRFGDERLEKGGPSCMGALLRMAAAGQRQAAGGRSRRRDADHAVSAQSQSAAQRDDVGGAGTHLRPGRRPPCARHSGHVGSAGGRERRWPVVSSGHCGGRHAGTVLGLVDNSFSSARAANAASAGKRRFEEKDSRRWLSRRRERQRPGRGWRGLRHGRRGSRRRHLRMLCLQAGQCGEAGARRPGPLPRRRNVSVQQGPVVGRSRPDDRWICQPRLAARPARLRCPSASARSRSSGPNIAPPPTVCPQPSA